VKVCQCTIVDVRQVSEIVRGSAPPELDCSLTDSLIDDKDDRSVVFDGAVHGVMCLSHAGIVSKRLHGSSWFLHTGFSVL